MHLVIAAYDLRLLYWSGSMADEQDKKQESHVLLWSLVTVFIIAAIAVMWAADYFYAPEMISPTTLPNAVGK
jgi:hypothetical protein